MNHNWRCCRKHFRFLPGADWLAHTTKARARHNCIGWIATEWICAHTTNSLKHDSADGGKWERKIQRTPARIFFIFKCIYSHVMSNLGDATQWTSERKMSHNNAPLVQLKMKLKFTIAFVRRPTAQRHTNKTRERIWTGSTWNSDTLFDTTCASVRQPF